MILTWPMFECLPIDFFRFFLIKANVYDRTVFWRTITLRTGTIFSFSVERSVLLDQGANSSTQRLLRTAREWNQWAMHLCNPYTPRKKKRKENKKKDEFWIFEFVLLQVVTTSCLFVLTIVSPETTMPLNFLVTQLVWDASALPNDICSPIMCYSGRLQ